MPFLSPNQQRQSTEGTSTEGTAMITMLTAERGGDVIITNLWVYFSV